MKGFRNCLRLLSQLNGKYYYAYLSDVRDELSDLFSKYDIKFGSVRMQRAAQLDLTTCKKKTSWGKIFFCSSHSVGSVASSNMSPWCFIQPW